MHPYYGWPFLSDPHHPVLSAAWAVLIRGTLSLIVVLPLVLRSERRLRYGVLAFAAGPALDLDHAVAATSFSPRAMEHLGHRPDTHSVLLGAILAVLALLITRRLVVAWSVFAVILVHLLFDASGGGTYVLYPLKHPDALPWLACPVGIVILTGFSWVLSRSRSSRRSGS